MKKLVFAAFLLAGTGAVHAAPEEVMSQDRSNAIANYVNGNEDCRTSKYNPDQCLPVTTDTRQILFGPTGPGRAVTSGKSGTRSGSRAALAKPPVDLGINFLLGSASLTETSKRSLDRLAASFVKAGKSATQFFVDGHTDRTGTCDVNLSLSDARANTALEYLAAAGVDRSRMTARGFGYEQLKTPSDPNAGINRRVEVLPKAPDSAAMAMKPVKC